MSLNRFWAGRVYGTNTGNLFLDLNELGPKLSGTLRLMDDRWGLAVFAIQGELGDRLKLTGQPVQAAEGVNLTPIEVEGSLTSEGVIRGTWSSQLGTAGIFALHPHDPDSDGAPVVPAGGRNYPAPNVPEQFYSKTVRMGAIRLFGDDVKLLLQQLKEDFTSGRIIVTYNARGSQVTKYSEDFLAGAATVGNIEYLKLQIQEPEAHGINKLIVIELDGAGTNEVRAQGIRESWVVGSAERLATYLKRHERKLATTFNPLGFNFQSIVLFALLVVLPSIPATAHRVALVVLAHLALVALFKAHSYFIPNARVNLASGSSDAVDRVVVLAISWGMALVSGVLTKIAYSWIADWLPISP